MKETTRLVALRSRTRVGVVAATTLASAVATLDANAVKVAVPAIGRSRLKGDEGTLQCPKEF